VNQKQKLYKNNVLQKTTGNNYTDNLVSGTYVFELK